MRTEIYALPESFAILSLTFFVILRISTWPDSHNSYF